ncbi:MAG: IclR family transcriptional regulator [Chloroflexi bacterium]|nr:IclR family transcriptional regulator [Chloroflexota bacterium]
MLAGNRVGLRLAEVANKLGSDRTNAQRILSTMEERGFVFRDEVSSRYKLTFLVTSLGFRHLEAAGVSEWAQPTLDNLASATRELVRLAAGERDKLRWIACAQGADDTLIVDPVQGKEVPLHATANGKAWLAQFQDEDAIKLVLRQGFHARTPKTITSVDALREELRLVRERGYGTADEEADLGVVAVSVVIVRENRPLGTISVAAPTTRATVKTLEQFVPLVRKAATVLADTWGPYVDTLIPNPVTETVIRSR